MTNTIYVDCYVCNKKMEVPQDHMVYYNLNLEVYPICSSKCKEKYMEIFQKKYDMIGIKSFKDHQKTHTTQTVQTTNQQNQTCCVIS